MGTTARHLLLCLGVMVGAVAAPGAWAQGAGGAVLYVDADAAPGGGAPPTVAVRRLTITR